MKYKRLTTEELQALEPEFVNYLATAQITAQDWEKMKLAEKDKAEDVIDIFCDMVYDRVLRKIKLLEYRDKHTLNIFNCLDDKLELIGLRAKASSLIDFTKENAFSSLTEEQINSIEMVRAEKDYTKEREMELFDLLQTGCFITDDRLYNILKGLIKK